MVLTVVAARFDVDVELSLLVIGQEFSLKTTFRKEVDELNAGAGGDAFLEHLPAIAACEE